LPGWRPARDVRVVSACVGAAEVSVVASVRLVCADARAEDRSLVPKICSGLDDLQTRGGDARAVLLRPHGGSVADDALARQATLS